MTLSVPSPNWPGGAAVGTRRSKPWREAARFGGTCRSETGTRGESHASYGPEPRHGGLVRLRLATAAATGIIAVFSFCLASPAVADCAGPTAETVRERVEAGEGSVFVGEVVYGGPDRPRLRVAEVWAGPDLASMVTVKTGPEQLPWPLSAVLRRASSVDGNLELGQSYVVATHADFRTDGCTSLLADDQILAAAPDDARPPVEGGLGGHRPRVFDTALGATLLTALLGMAGMLAVGRRLDAAAQPSEEGPLRAAGRGALIGGAVGFAVGGLVELATYATFQMFPTDVGVFGFGLIFGTPAAAAVGALCWWRRWPSSAMLRLVLAAVPVLALGAFQVFVQWSAQ